jgi:hypothetical protein
MRERQRRRMVVVEDNDQQHLALLICYPAFSVSTEIGRQKFKSFWEVLATLVKKFKQKFLAQDQPAVEARKTS